MFRAGRVAGKAGESADLKFEAAFRSWKRRVLRPVMLICGGLAIALILAGHVTIGDWKVLFGMLAGGTLAIYVAFSDSPPNHIEKWRQGSTGEKLTAKVLKRLVRKQRWHVRHDLTRSDGTNIDHVLVSQAGVFLLDSKNWHGEATVEDGELKVRQLDDSGETWSTRRLSPSIRAASADLAERIEAASHVRVWVQPVVVMWMPFPQRVVESSNVVFVQGEALGDWLASRPPASHPFDSEQVGEFVTTVATPLP